MGNRCSNCYVESVPIYKVTVSVVMMVSGYSNYYQGHLQHLALLRKDAIYKSQ